ncbi:ATP-binding protein [Microbacterium hominis]|uniref:AAA family ATPase n=1 Tax=Microbacterium TaxID=33882 RepID=UPI00168BCEB9|nr:MULTISPECIES: ATP-binding protein [Microbacterium]QOC24554.1 ATP-binding protein [Microbacterium hominis]QOC28623.1 ATP-binding protein [Microbacterium hominis]QYF99147.1 ATP-binding protein [Microbacterium sp. PAMC21962]
MTSHLFFVIGPAGSGKSTVSTLIARQLGAAYLDKDSVATLFTEALLVAHGSDPHERDNNAYYQQVVMDLEYQTLLRLAGDNLRLGTPVVLDAPFVRYFPQPDYLERAALAHDWPADTRITVVHVSVDGARVRDRVAGRGYQRDSWKLAHWDEFWASAQAAECRWRGAHHALYDNSADGRDDDAIRAAIAALV